VALNDLHVGRGDWLGQAFPSRPPWAKDTVRAVTDGYPEHEYCVLESLAADRLVFVPGPHRSQMAGLNCARASDLAWPLLRAGLSAVVAIGDDRAEAAMAELERLGVESGHSGAAGLAGLRALGDELDGRSVLVINTEGATHLHA